ncbi:hypothetical protein CCACVL1_00589, partial [Corchorus capsularis]
KLATYSWNSYQTVINLNYWTIALMTAAVAMDLLP